MCVCSAYVVELYVGNIAICSNTCSGLHDPCFSQGH